MSKTNEKNLITVEGEFYVKCTAHEETIRRLQEKHERVLTTKDAEKADWIRSEIEELEGKLGTFGTEKGNSHCEVETCEVCQWNIGAYEGNNHALTSIITRYKEELKVLESK